MKLLPLACVLGCLAVCGCREELPRIKSGYAAPAWVKAGAPGTKPLTEAQIKGLSLWLDLHQEGWRTEITDAPLGRLVCLTSENGKSVWLNLLPDRVWVGKRYHTLSPTERAALESILVGP